MRRSESRLAVEISPPSSVADQVEVWVDALFGTGLKRPVEGVCQAWVEQLNEQEIPIVSLDIPSGVWGESGAVINNIAVQADHTISPQHLLNGVTGRFWC